MKILIIRLSSIGDCVLSTPVLEALRDRYPEAHLTWAVQSKSVDVVRGLPGLDEVLLWDSKSPDRNLRYALKLTWQKRFDIALDLHGLDKAALFALASRAKRRISGTSARFLAYRMSNERVDESEFLHAREFYLRRASLLDIAPDAATRYYPRVPITDADQRRAEEFLAENRVDPGARLVGFNLGASEPEKIWPPERFAQLGHRLLQEDGQLRIVVFGAPADEWLYRRFQIEFDRITEHKGELQKRVVSAVGVLSLMELAAVSQRCTVFVSADTGPMHIAAAAGAPLLALFGPTDANLTAPVHNPGNLPVKVLDGRDISGSWPASMNVWSVARVQEEVYELMKQTELMREKATKTELEVK